MNSPGHRIVRMAVMAGATAALFASVSIHARQQDAAGASPAAPATQSQSTQLPPGDPANGKTAYMEYGCYSCHGFMGRAGGGGPKLVDPAPAAERLIRYVRKPTGSMPSYTSKSISDKALIDIRAFLATIPKDPSVNTLPLLNDLNK